MLSERAKNIKPSPTLAIDEWTRQSRGSNEAKMEMAMKHIFTVIISIFLFLPATTFAETKEIIAEGTYNMGDGETPTVAESRALLQAKRIALEQAGTYVESYTKVKNLQLTEDEIKVLASGIMEVSILGKKRTVIGDGIHFWVKIKAKVNPDNIKDMAAKVTAKSVSRLQEDYKMIQAAYDKSQQAIEELKKQLAQAKGEKEKKQVVAKITDKERLFQANEWFEKGKQYDKNKDYNKAIEYYLKAISSDPIHVNAMINLGIILETKDKNFSDAEYWYKKASEASPDNHLVYYNLGFLYSNKEFSKYNIDTAIGYYQKVVTLKSDHDLAYFYMGNLYYHDKKEYPKAIASYEKAIQLYGKDPAYNNNLGLVYEAQKEYVKAEGYYRESIKIDPSYGVAWESLGYALYFQQKDNEAKEAWKKASSLGRTGAKDALKKYFNITY